MKKILGVVVLSFIAFYSFKDHGALEVKKVVSKIPAMITTVGKETKKEEMAITPETKMTSIDEYEEKMSAKTTEEIKSEMAKNDEVAKNKNFIEKANNNKLTKEEEKEFIQNIRLNVALNKILMERKLDDIETERL